MVLWRKRPPVEDLSIYQCGTVLLILLFSVVLWKNCLAFQKINFAGSGPVVLWRKRPSVEDLSMYQYGTVLLILCGPLVLWKNCLAF